MRLFVQYAGLVPPMLEGGLDVMIYAGDKDLICNWLGNRRWVDALEWHGKAAWHDADDFTWSVDGDDAAKIRQSGRLSFVKVFDAGHMVRSPVLGVVRDCLVGVNRLRLRNF